MCLVVMMSGLWLRKVWCMSLFWILGNDMVDLGFALVATSLGMVIVVCWDTVLPCTIGRAKIVSFEEVAESLPTLRVSILSFVAVHIGIGSKRSVEMRLTLLSSDG